MDLQHMLKTYREHSGLSMEQESKGLKVSVSLIKSWEDGTDTPTLRQCKRISEFYGISRRTMLKKYIEAVWPQREVLEDFPDFLFSDEALPYIMDLSFTPEETTLLKMIDLYHNGRLWRIDSRDDARDLLKELPPEYVSEESLGDMMDIKRKLWPTGPGFRQDDNMSFQRFVMNSLRQTDGSEPVAAFSVKNVTSQELVWLAQEINMLQPGHSDRYLPRLDHTVTTYSNSVLRALKEIDEGNERVCDIVRSNDQFVITMSSDWKRAVPTSFGPIYRSQKTLDNALDRISSSWVTYTYDEENAVCVASKTDKGKRLWEFYQGNQNLFNRSDKSWSIYCDSWGDDDDHDCDSYLIDFDPDELISQDEDE